MPEVSVVIPTRNRLGMLEQAVESALGQRGVDVEVVVVDEGSSDATPAWLASHADPRVRSIRHDEPRRLPGARNAGVEHASAPLVAFLDDDDLWSFDKLRLQLEAQRASSAAWSCVGCVHVGEELQPVAVSRVGAPAELAEALRTHNAVPGGGSGVLVDREALLGVGGFDETLHAVEDWDCWMRLLRAHGAPATVDRPLLAYRRLAQSMSHDIERMLTALRRVAGQNPEITLDDASGLPVGTVSGLARLAAESGDRRSAARLLWRDRRDRATLVRAPLYLATPLAVLRASFLLRRPLVRWAAPLVEELRARELDPLPA